MADEIACRALLTGGRVVSARRPDLPRDASLAAILRHAGLWWAERRERRKAA